MSLSPFFQKGVLEAAHEDIAANSMIVLNDAGIELAEIDEITALTDVTGFGLLGHLLEVCEGSNVSAEINYSKVPIFEEIHTYLDKKCVPGGTIRNWESYGHKVTLEDEKRRHILCDPQTSGGLLIAVKKEASQKVAAILKSKGLFAEPIGTLIEKSAAPVYIND